MSSLPSRHVGRSVLNHRIPLPTDASCLKASVSTTRKVPPRQSKLKLARRGTQRPELNVLHYAHNSILHTQRRLLHSWLRLPLEILGLHSSVLNKAHTARAKPDWGYEIPSRTFAQAVLDCLPEEGIQWVVPPKSDDCPEWRGREDLRELLAFSIDPIDCQDIDDALHVRQLANGNIEAGVHIADVTRFVCPDTAIDDEAAARGATTYLVDDTIHMLPELLSTKLCSLWPGEERLAFSVIWELTPDAEIVNVRFTKSVVVSKHAFSYQEAQARKDDLSINDAITGNIRLLNSLAKKLRAKRIATGALAFATPEVKVYIDRSDVSGTVDLGPKALLETNSLIEEFMLLANISVAYKIRDAFPDTAVLRRHPPPLKSMFERLQDTLYKRKGLTLDISSSGTLAACLDKCVDPSDPAFNVVIRILASRCMMAAEYFCGGGGQSSGHYGLATPVYTHFTSPIRRYTDILTHRQLAAAISYSPLPAGLRSQEYIQGVLEVVNRRQRVAQSAYRASVERYVGLALKRRAERREVMVEEAFVMRTLKIGIVVYVSRLGIEGFVPYDREVQYDPENYTVVIPSQMGYMTISVYDKIKVQMVRVEPNMDPNQSKIRMTLASPLGRSDLSTSST